MTFYKRILSGVVAQLFTITPKGNTESYNWFEAERKFYGEGLKKGELIPITLDEFKEIACKYNCLSAPEPLSVPSSSHSS